MGELPDVDLGHMKGFVPAQPAKAYEVTGLRTDPYQHMFLL